MSPHTKPRDLKHQAAETLYKSIQTTKIMAPPTNCISPIGEKAILSGLYKQIKGEFYTAVSRPPAVYRGNPFIIEAGLAFGKGPEEATKPQQAAMPLAEGEDQGNDTEHARVIRYANRVPLLYQQSACATFKAALSTTWRNYGVSQSRGALPAGPMVIFVHMASVWVPFTSESKEAIADYDEIQKEITLALREAAESGVNAPLAISDREAVDELDTLLRDAVRIRTVADAPMRLRTACCHAGTLREASTTPTESALA